MTTARKNILWCLGIHLTIIIAGIIVYTIIWSENFGGYLCNVPFQVKNYTVTPKNCDYRSDTCYVGVLIGIIPGGNKSNISGNDDHGLFNDSNSRIHEINKSIFNDNDTKSENQNAHNVRISINIWSASKSPLEIIDRMSKNWPINTNISVCVKVGTSDGIIKRYDYMEYGEPTFGDAIVFFTFIGIVEVVMFIILFIRCCCERYNLCEKTNEEDYNEEDLKKYEKSYHRVCTGENSNK